MKTYVVRFGTGDPRNSAGLAPTMLLFSVASSGQTLVGPGFSEINSTWGMYAFQWGTTTPIAFLADGATSGLGSARYVTGSLDPADRIDEVGTTLVAIGTSNIALGTTNVALGVTGIAQGNTMVALGISIYAMVTGTSISISVIGTAGSTFGGLTTDPIDLFGYMKRIQEDLEGNQTFTKGTGAWQISSRGSSTVLANKTITNGASLVTRS